jgi:hypothetical protein
MHIDKKFQTKRKKKKVLRALSFFRTTTLFEIRPEYSGMYS